MIMCLECNYWDSGLRKELGPASCYYPRNSDDNEEPIRQLCLSKKSPNYNKETTSRDKCRWFMPIPIFFGRIE